MNLKDLIADVNVNEIYEHIETETLSEWVNAWQKAALSALHPVSREQLERVWPGCSFCKNDGVQDYRTAVCVTRWGMSYLKGPEIESDDIFYAQNHFCRFCGRPLTLEAWKEMRKRWEAANDAD
jgi:hypothetical protein|nr:MAG TPA: Rad50 zinc hook motif [Caudoviricetes sp.]